MRFSIKHHTQYEYSNKVFVEPHTLYFTPLFRVFQKTIHFDIQVNPTASGMSSGLDVENNTFHQVWFNELIDGFTIDTYLEMESKEYNPFDFLPQKVSHWHSGYACYLACKPMRADIIDWYSQARADQAINFLINLNQLVNDSFQHESRYTEDILSVENLFDSKTGSCRDLSYLMIEILRTENIPARFISGYAFNPELSEGHELHAWVEAFIPGGGWVGADPSAGVLTGNQYVPVCASFNPKNTLPVQGNYRGDAASTLITNVKIEALS